MRYWGGDFLGVGKCCGLQYQLEYETLKGHFDASGWQSEVVPVEKLDVFCAFPYDPWEANDDLLNQLAEKGVVAVMVSPDLTEAVLWFDSDEDWMLFKLTYL